MAKTTTPEVLGKPVNCRVMIDIENGEGWTHRRILTGASLVMVAEYTDGYIIRVFTDDEPENTELHSMGAPIGSKKFGR